MSHHKRHRIKLKSLYQWHRHLGAAIALFTLMLAITGLMLNHTDELQLARQFVQSSWILDHYGIRPPETVRSYRSTQHWISQWEQRLFLNQKDLGSVNDPLVGALQYQGMVVMALENSLLLYNAQGELIERLGSNEGIPGGISAIGVSDQQKLALKAALGVFTADTELLIWQQNPDAITVWTDHHELPAPLSNALLQQYRGKGLSLERLLLDLHSGRFLAHGGVYFMDLVALLLVFLGVSGLWMWTQRLIRGQQRNKQKRQ